MMKSLFPFVEIDPDVRIGQGCVIWHFSRILRGSTLGDHCNIGQNVVIGPDVRIGAKCRIQNNVSVYKGATLEDEVFCGPGMVFTNVLNPRAGIPKMDQMRETLVRKGATLGANCVIICGVSIGKWAFVGAGAVVTRSVPDFALVYGNPARLRGYVCVCGEKLDKNLRCHVCGRQYMKKNNQIMEA